MCQSQPGYSSRRDFIKLAALGAGAVMLGSFLPRTAFASGQADALLLSCMDYRLVDDTERFMASKGLKDKYDHVILAGASLGALTGKFPAWNTAFWEHLGVAIKLHQVHKVVLLDHRDCGAYKVVKGEDFGKMPEKETEVHAETLMALRNSIIKQHQALEVECYLMALDGSVEHIIPA